LVFFESPRRLAETLQDLAAVLGARPAAIARELTKHFETVRRGDLNELAQALAQEEPPRGEIVLLVGPPQTGTGELSPEDLDQKLLSALQTLSVKDAAAVVSAQSGQNRRQVYARAVELAAQKKSREDD